MNSNEYYSMEFNNIQCKLYLMFYEFALMNSMSLWIEIHVVNGIYIIKLK